MNNTPFKIALRYLFSKKTKNIINLISGISLTVVACVAAAMVIILSAFNGIEELVDGLFNKFDPDITISPAEGKVLHNDSINFDLIHQIDGISHVTSVLEETAILSKGQERKTLCQLFGVDTTFLAFTGIKSDVRYGQYSFHEVGENYIIPGVGIASDLNLSLRNGEPEPIKVHAYIRGKRLSRSREKALKEGLALTTGAFTINADLDLNYVLTTLKFARKIFDYENQSSFIGIELVNEDKSGNIKEQLQNVLSDDFLVKTRKENNPMVYETNASEKKATSLILLFIMIIAIFNGMASLTILILEKRNDIKVLTSMGATWSFVKQVFMFEGVLINVIGAILGIVLGLIVCALQIQFGFVGSEGTVIDQYPIKIEWGDILMILLTVIIVGFLATWSMVNYLIGRLSKT